MPPTKMNVNGVDLSAYGLWVETPTDFGSAPEREDQVLESRAAGGYLLADAVRVKTKEWTVEATLIGQSVSDARDQWDQIKLILSDAWLEVTIEPWTDRMSVCRYQRAEWRPGPRGMEMGGWRVALTFLAANPWLVSPLVDSYGLLAGGSIIPLLGSAPSPFIARFIGLAVNPSLIYRDANGRTRGTIVLAGTIAANEWLEFDSQTLRIERHTPAGALVNGAPFFSTASQLFSLDPLDGTPDRGPSLTLDVGSALIYTRKCWR